MAKATSFHLKPCDLVNSEAHNRRLRKFDYVREDLSHLNESHSYIEHSLQKEHSKIQKEVKEKTGRKLQKNAITIKEGVIVIKDDTTMEDIRRFCAQCEDRWGIVPLQIHMHKDEGHWKGKAWIPNLHAHIVWRMYNREGRNCRIKNVDCSEMQTIAAEVLGMDRGKPSKKKHLAAMEYKIQQQEQRIEELEMELKGKNETVEKLRGVYEGAKQGAADKFTGKMRKRAEKAEKEAAEARMLAERSQNKADSIMAKINEQTRKYNEEMRLIKETLSKAQPKLENYQRMADRVEALESKDRRMQGILKDSARIGLTAHQVLSLQTERQISCKQIQLEEQTISRSDGKSILVRIKDGILELHNVVQWQKVWDWCKDVVRSPWYSINGIPNDRKQGQSLGI